MSVEVPFAALAAVLLLASVSVLTTLVGVALAIYAGGRDRAIALGIGFSAGIMLLVSFLELVPEARSGAGTWATAVAFLLGTGIVASLHWVIPHTHLVKEQGVFRPDLLKTAYMVAFGLILHDVPEGFAMANSYLASPSLGILVAAAIAAHNLPEEFAMAVPIVAARSKRFLFQAAFLSGLAEPLGALLGLVAVHFYPGFNPLFMAFAAGAMVFVSVHELLPMARRYGHGLLFAAGMAVSGLVYGLLVVLIPEAP